MLNTAPSRSLTRRSRNLLVIGFIVSSIGIFLLAVGLFLRLVPTFFGQTTTAGQFQSGIGLFLLIIGILGFLGGTALAVRALTRRRENDLAYLTGEHLSQFLDERYQFIRNINRPKLGYIDAVLVGPPGVLVFRILSMSGELLNERGGWVKRSRNNDWVPLRVNPTEEAIVDVKAMREFANSQKIRNLDVYGVVVFLEDPPMLNVQLKDPVVPVAHLSALLDTLKSNYLAKERLNQSAIDRLTQLLLGDL